MLSMIPHLIIDNEEQKCLRVLGHLDAHNAGLVAHLFGPNRCVSICTAMAQVNLTCIEDLHNVSGVGIKRATVLVEYAYDVVYKRESDKLRKKAKGQEARGANRIKYLPRTLFRRYETQDGKERWEYIQDLRSGGLLELACEYTYGERPTPSVVGVLNNLPEEEFGNRRAVTDSTWTAKSGRGFSRHSPRSSMPEPTTTA